MKRRGEGEGEVPVIELGGDVFLEGLAHDVEVVVGEGR